MDVFYIVISAYLLSIGHYHTSAADTREDDGQCIPIYCDLGVPPEKCTTLCGLQKYVPICKEPANICLCQKLVNNRIELVSPDEVEASTNKPEAGNNVESEGIIMGIFTFIKPLENSVWSYEKSPEVEEEGYVIETVNVHDGKLFYAFSCILSGLFILMIGLIVYELIMCKRMNSSSTEQLIGKKSGTITHI